MVDHLKDYIGLASYLPAGNQAVATGAATSEGLSYDAVGRNSAMVRSIFLSLFMLLAAAQSTFAEPSELLLAKLLGPMPDDTDVTISTKLSAVLISGAKQELIEGQGQLLAGDGKLLLDADGMKTSFEDFGSISWGAERDWYGYGFYNTPERKWNHALALHMQWYWLFLMVGAATHFDENFQLMLVEQQPEMVVVDFKLRDKPNEDFWHKYQARGGTITGRLSIVPKEKLLSTAVATASLGEIKRTWTLTISRHTEPIPDEAFVVPPAIAKNVAQEYTLHQLNNAIK